MSGIFPSQKYFDAQMSLIWSNAKPQLTITIDSSLLLSIKSLCNRVYKFFLDLKSFEVIAHDQYFEYQDPVAPVCFDGTLIRQGNSIITMYMDTTITNKQQTILYPIVYNIIDSASREFLKGFTYAKETFIIKAQDFTFYKYNKVTKLSQVVENLTLAVNSIKYPIIGTNCRVCLNKTTCPWSNE